MKDLMCDISTLTTTDEQKALQEQFQTLSETLNTDIQQLFANYSQDISKQLKDSLILPQLSLNLSESIDLNVSELIRELVPSISGLVNFEIKGNENLSDVLKYIKEYEYLIDPDITIDEALQQIKRVSSGDLHVELNSKQINLLSFCISALDALQDQDVTVFLIWIIMSILAVAAKESN